MVGRRGGFRASVPPSARPRRLAEHRRMSPTRFWLIRHAMVAENARLVLYGTMDVPLCEESLAAQEPMYRALAERLPRPAIWKVTPLSRTHRTAEALFAAGYPRAEPETEPDLTEQALGSWQGLVHAALPGETDAARPRFLALARGRAPAWRGKHSGRHRTDGRRLGAPRGAACRGGHRDRDARGHRPRGCRSCARDRAGSALRSRFRIFP